MTYVSDTVNGFIRIAETPETVGEVINIGTGHGVTIGELAERVLALLEMDKPIVAAEERVRPERSEVFKLICDNRKANELLNWQPQVSLDEGLRAVINWIKANQSSFKSDIYNV